MELENRMVMDREWEHLIKGLSKEGEEGKERSSGPGYEEIGTGIFVPEEDAYKYALERIAQDKEVQQEFVEWFYSGNWVKEN